MKTRTWILGAKAVRAWALALATVLATAPAAGSGTYSPPGSDTTSLPANISSDLAEITAALLPDTMVRVIVGANGTMSIADKLRLQTLLASWGGSYAGPPTSVNGVPRVAEDAAWRTRTSRRRGSCLQETAGPRRLVPHASRHGPRAGPT